MEKVEPSLVISFLFDLQQNHGKFMNKVGGLHRFECVLERFMVKDIPPVLLGIAKQIKEYSTFYYEVKYKIPTRNETTEES